MWERIQRAKRRIQASDEFQHKQEARQSEVDGQLDKKKQKEAELLSKNDQGVSLIRQAMDNPGLNDVLRELDKRLNRIGKPRSRKQEKHYPDRLEESYLLRGVIKYPSFHHESLNGIVFTYNTYTNDGLRIYTEYSRDESDGSPDGYNQLSDSQSFSSVEELVNALVDGIAYYELGEPDFNIFNFYSLTRKRD